MMDFDALSARALEPHEIKTQEDWDAFEARAWLAARRDRGLPLLGMSCDAAQAVVELEAIPDRVKTIILRIGQLVPNRAIPEEEWR